MSLLDFKEISAANVGGSGQDHFELFAQEFFSMLGNEVTRGPSRGADAGCDLILRENRTGVGGTSTVKWLVSCKHKAHSATSVGKSEEPEVLDSVQSNGCDGFIGFYSTLPSSGLLKKVVDLAQIDNQFFDAARIERELLATSKGREIAERFFPDSYGNWTRENPTKAQVFAGSKGIQCIKCGADITEGREGIFVQWDKSTFDGHSNTRAIRETYCCCRGKCDKELIAERSGSDYHDKWDDLHDRRIPVYFIRVVMSLLNELQNGDSFSEESFEEEKRVILELFPYVARDMTKKELERVQELGMLPAYLGGLGVDA